MVEVRLPVRPSGDPDQPDAQGITLRIPEQGGLPEPGSDLPRGLLLLTLVASQEADPRVKLVRRAAPDRTASPLGEEGAVGAGAFDARARLLVVVAIVVVALWILLLIWLRLSGQG